MRKNILTRAISALLITTLSLCGCSKQTQTEEPQEEPQAPVYEIQYTEKMEDLIPNHFYIETEFGYAEPYWGYTSFDTPIVSSPDNSRVAWFMDDFAMIPTMYKGDKIVYRTGAEFTEHFDIERFLDDGYTFGICNLMRSESGRYKVSTSPDAYMMNPESDAAKLVKYGGQNVTIDAVAGQPLRIGRITQSGTIANLEQGQEYPIDLYVGTEIQDESLICDSRVLFSAQTATLYDFDYIRADIIEIPIPEYFNSGYYNINGFGIVRYVNGDSYDENTDFNIMNASSQEEYERLKRIEEGAVNELIDQITIYEDGVYELSIYWSDEYVSSLLQEGQEPGYPSVTLNVGDETNVRFEFNENSKSSTGGFAAKAGVYDIEFKNLLGRAYTFSLTRVGDIPTEPAVPATQESAVQESSVPAETQPSESVPETQENEQQESEEESSSDEQSE